MKARQETSDCLPYKVIYNATTILKLAEHHIIAPVVKPTRDGVSIKLIVRPNLHIRLYNNGNILLRYNQIAKPTTLNTLKKLITSWSLKRP